jgi:flagellar basal body-associated protein FliL
MVQENNAIAIIIIILFVVIVLVAWGIYRLVHAARGTSSSSSTGSSDSLADE